MEGPMGATAIAVIVLVVLFLGGMTALVVYMNTDPRTGPKETTKKQD
jgi:hypothetical protein